MWEVLWAGGVAGGVVAGAAVVAAGVLVAAVAEAAAHTQWEAPEAAQAVHLDQDIQEVVQQEVPAEATVVNHPVEIQ